VRICERNNSVDTKVSEEGGGGGVPAVASEIPLQPVEVHSGADIHPAAQAGSHARASGGALKQSVTLWKVHAAAGLVAGPETLWRGVHIGAGLLVGSVASQGTHAGAVCS